MSARLQVIRDTQRAMDRERIQANIQAEWVGTAIFNIPADHIAVFARQLTTNKGEGTDLGKALLKLIDIYRKEFNFVMESTSDLTPDRVKQLHAMFSAAARRVTVKTFLQKPVDTTLWVAVNPNDKVWWELQEFHKRGPNREEFEKALGGKLPEGKIDLQTLGHIRDLFEAIERTESGIEQLGKKKQENDLRRGDLNHENTKIHHALVGFYKDLSLDNLTQKLKQAPKEDKEFFERFLEDSFATQEKKESVFNKLKGTLGAKWQARSDEILAELNKLASDDNLDIGKQVYTSRLVRYKALAEKLGLSAEMLERDLYIEHQKLISRVRAPSGILALPPPPSRPLTFAAASSSASSMASASASAVAGIYPSLAAAPPPANSETDEFLRELKDRLSLEERMTKLLESSQASRVAGLKADDFEFEDDDQDELRLPPPKLPVW